MTPIELARLAHRTAWPSRDLQRGECVEARKNQAPGTPWLPATVVSVERRRVNDAWRTVVELRFAEDGVLFGGDDRRTWVRPSDDVKQYACEHLRSGDSDDEWHERHYRVDPDTGQHFVGCECRCRGCIAIHTAVDA